MMEHPYLKYALALVMKENDLTDPSMVTAKMLKREIENGLNAFCIKPMEDYVGKQQIKFGFCKKKNKASAFVFLSPHVISPDKAAAKLYDVAKSKLEMPIDDLLTKEKITKGVMPTAGEYSSFSLQGSVGRGKPSVTQHDYCLALITTLTRWKPSLCRQGDYSNVCLIPDLPVPALVKFIKLFKRICRQKNASDLMLGNVLQEGKKKVSYKPIRPTIFRGNFPNAPRSSALFSLSLLSVIGEMTKEAEVSELALQVLSSLKEANIYSIEYGKAEVFGYHHFVIDLSSCGHLRTIVSALSKTRLYNNEQKDEKRKFELFASRFTRLLNRPSFRDFLAFRAEYPKGIKLLLTVYFMKVEKIDADVVASAEALGKWLNSVAYFSAVKEAGSQEGKVWEEKAKILSQLESSIIAAKSGDALMAQVIVRAGRLSGHDAPKEATLFMRKTAEGVLSLEQAKNLLMAFSRVRSEKANPKDAPTDDTESEEEEDYSEI